MWNRASTGLTVVGGLLSLLIALGESGALHAQETAAAPVAASDGAADASGGSGGSNASNFGGSAHFTINARTGGVALQVPLLHLPGVHNGISASLSLSYQSEDAISNYQAEGGSVPPTAFGLPNGWSLNLSYIQTRSVNNQTYQELNVDGGQSYVVDPNWKTTNPATGNAVSTGLQQYNKLDANFRELSDSEISVGGLTAQYQFANLNGTARFLASGGLLIQETDRFGSSIEYHYVSDCGDDPAKARLDYILDSWGNRIDFAYPSNPCSAIQGEVKIILPDGRTVGYVVEGQITQVIDAEGKIMRIDWRNASNIPSECSQFPVPTGITSPAGGYSALNYQCMAVCTETTSPNSCAASNAETQWPVALELLECAVGSPPCTQASQGVHVTKYAIGGTGSDSGLVNPSNNYTGFPYFSPFAPNPQFPGSDPLMSASGQQKFDFEYQTAVSRLNPTQVALRTTDTYTFLHLLKERQVSAFAKQTNGYYALKPIKTESRCYGLPGSDASGCPLNSQQIDYQSLPANYQAATTTGSCVYDVGAVQNSDARVSVTSKAYNGFGSVVSHERYHGDSSTGTISGECTRSDRLDPSSLKLVLEEYKEFDLPDVAIEGYLPLGPGGGSYGLAVAAQSFAYLDVDEDGVHGELGSTAGPVQVTLSCREPAGLGLDIPAGAAIVTNTHGALPITAEPPSDPGAVPACSQLPTPAWDTTLAPPKMATYSYDALGRQLGRALEWTDGSRPGIESTEDTFTYAMAAAESSEQACTQSTDGTNSNPVLERTRIDAKGHKTVSRVCTLNNFPLSTIDANLNKVLFEHDATGLLTKTTHPNGTSIVDDYHYACPVALSGSTCPTSLTACPYDTATAARSCVIRTLNAGSEKSYADGTAHVTIKDGAGRVVESRDNLGAGDGAYTSWQTRSQQSYNNLGLLVTGIDLLGTTDPLMFTTTTTYDPKFRPALVCGPRGTAHEFIRDDVAQSTKRMINGHQKELTTVNDSRKITAIEDCAAGQDTVAKGTGACPAVTSDLTSPVCAGDVFNTSLLRDGTGVQRSTSAFSSNAKTFGGSVASVTGQATYSADHLKYNYALKSEPVAQNSQVASSSTWTRDLQGMSTGLDVTVTSAFTGPGTTSASDSFAYDELAHTTSDTSNLSADLKNVYTYTPTGMACTRTDFAGTKFTYFYDTLDRMTRHCYPAMICAAGSNAGAGCDGDSDCPNGTCVAGSQGENLVLDPITGSPLTVENFSNPQACGACSAEPPTTQDIAGDKITFGYSDIGKITSKTYTEAIDGKTVETALAWSYDAYHRKSCYADAIATAAGSACPTSPTAAEWWTANSDPYLAWYVYWPQDDPHRRGLLQSACRRDGTGVVQCVDTDYYTSSDSSGGCASQFSQGADLTGAFAGLSKSETLCTGGSCLSGSGTAVYSTTHEYGPHRRSCSVVSCEGGDACKAGSGSLILASTYSYDQFNNVVSERHQSDLDATSSSNYEMNYTYDGLMRLLASERTDLEGGKLETISYKYDASSNIWEKIQTVYE